MRKTDLVLSSNVTDEKAELPGGSQESVYIRITRRVSVKIQVAGPLPGGRFGMRCKNLHCNKYLSGTHAAVLGTTFQEPLTKTNLPKIRVRPEFKLEPTLHLDALKL